MDFSLQGLQEYGGFVAFVLLFVASRLIVRSSVKFLDDDSKIKLVDAGGKYNWMYILVVIAFGLFFVDVRIGLLACFAYFILGVSLNYRWAKKNGLPTQYRNRVVLGNSLILIGFVAIVAQFGLFNL